MTSAIMVQSLMILLPEATLARMGEFALKKVDTTVHITELTVVTVFVAFVR